MKKLALIIALASLAFSIATYPLLPAIIPVHWGASGVANSFAPKFPAAFITPILSIALIILLDYLPALDPKHANYKAFEREFELLKIIFAGFFLGLNLLITAASAGLAVPIAVWMPFLMGLLFAALGLILPGIKRNYFVGIRTPWTLDSDDNWDKTHRFGGKVFLWTGLLIAAYSLLVPNIFVFVTVILMASGSTVLYSYLLFRKEKGKGANRAGRKKAAKRKPKR